MATATVEHRLEIVSTIGDANLGVTVVSREEEADVILVFCTDSLESRCHFSTSSFDISDVGYGSVYTVQPDGLRLAMLYSERCTLRSHRLAKSFGEAFVQVYRTAIK